MSTLAADLPEGRQAPFGQNRTMAGTGQPVSVYDNPLLSGDFQLPWGGMLGSGLVVREK